MAKIFTISNEQSAPDWFINQPQKFAGTQADADRIASLPEELSESAFDQEVDLIEKCASTNSPYFYNANWDANTTERLQEFASAYNVKAIASKPSDPLVQEAKSQVVVKTASAQVIKPSQSLTISDPFHLDSKGNMDHMAKAEWQSPTHEAKAISPSIFMNSGAVLRMSGSEDTRIHSHMKSTPGQNSVTNPKALEELSKQVDTGVRLRQEANERSESRKVANREWETSFSQTLKENKLTGTAKIAHDAGQAGGKAFGSLHLDVIPDKTTGEQLKSQSESRKQEIQREAKNTREWDDIQGTTKAKVGDLLIAGLEAGLQKIASAKTTTKKA